MRKILMPALIAGLFVAACGDDTTTGGGGSGGSNGGGTEGGGGSTTQGGGGSTTDGGGGAGAECGDGVVDDGEDCDDGNTSADDGCSPACAVDVGFECTGEPSVCSALCGDGIIAGSEECDDENIAANDGCDATCGVETGYDCVGEPSICATDCGDGILAGDEECDDNNAVAGDGCDLLCVVESGYDCVGEPSDCSGTCGDGVIAVGEEECDDAGTTAGDGCDATCQTELGWSCMDEPSTCTTNCGDGTVAGAEGCDDGDNTDGDGCSAACAEEAGFDCTGSPSNCVTTCGDGITAGTETCDDSNTTAGDCCSATCTVEAGCETEPNNTDLTADDFAAHQVGGVVNGFVDPSGDANWYSFTLSGAGTISAETLDGILGTTCASNDVDSRIRIFSDADLVTPVATDDDSGAGFCSLATTGLLAAGTYYIVVDASTFDPTLTFDYALTITENLAICGDGGIDPGEQCDDGNLVNGDGCSSTCQSECPGLVESEVNDTFDVADGPMANNVQNCGAITPNGDDDFWSFTIGLTSTVTFETFDASGNQGCPDANDTHIFLFGTDGVTQISSNDDLGAGDRCSRIVRTNMPAGTYFLRVIEFEDNGPIGGYRVRARVDAACGNAIVEGTEECDGGATCNADCTRIPVCGDGFIDAPETCDDSNTNNGDGCSSLCVLENLFNETEPNDDGATATATNDFLAAAANGPFSVDTMISGAISPAGDDDVYAVTNPTASPIIFTAETFSNAAGTACVTTDTDIRVRDAGGAQLALSQDEGQGACSHISYQLNPGQTLYLHVIENGDNAALAAYFMKVTFLNPFTSATETEPNEDGTPQTGGTGIAGNDFDATAVANATANGLLSGDVLVSAAMAVVGDEDVYAVTNPTASPITIDLETFSSLGACATIDTGLHVRNAAGTALVTNDDEGLGLCSYVDNFVLAAGTTVYVHVTDFQDNSTIGSYQLLITTN
ncbi:MAG: DUF4215 domain-containing protein [Polyangiaceae bacterium]|nr:DUF4215 domain-containing protein [Polyangiaceae bacterium]